MPRSGRCGDRGWKRGPSGEGFVVWRGSGWGASVYGGEEAAGRAVRRRGAVHGNGSGGDQGVGIKGCILVGRGKGHGQHGHAYN